MTIKKYLRIGSKVKLKPSPTTKDFPEILEKFHKVEGIAPDYFYIFNPINGNAIRCNIAQIEQIKHYSSGIG